MEEIYKKELALLKWIIRLTERLTILTTSMRMKTDLGLTEDDRNLIRALCRMKELEDAFMYENIVINTEDPSQSVTQPDIFSDNTSVTAKVDTIDTDIDITPIETIKTKKK